MPARFASQKAFSRASMSAWPAFGRQDVHVDGAELRDVLGEFLHLILEPVGMPSLHDHREVRLGMTTNGIGDAERQIELLAERFHRQRVDVLKRGHADAGGNDPRHGPHEVRQVTERSQHRRLIPRSGVKAQYRLRDERQRSLRTDDQLREVITGRSLHELAAGPDDLPGGQHHLKTEHVVPRHSVLHGPHAACVRPDVAADGRAVFTREHGIEQSVLRGDLVEFGYGDARLHDRDHVLLIDLDPPHPFKRNDDAVGSRNDGTRNTNAATSRGDRNDVLVGDPQDGRYLSRRDRNDHRTRPLRFRGKRFVVAVVVVRIAGEDSVRCRGVSQQAQHVGHVHLPPQHPSRSSTSAREHRKGHRALRGYRRPIGVG